MLLDHDSGTSPIQSATGLHSHLLQNPRSPILLEAIKRYISQYVEQKSGGRSGSFKHFRPNPDYSFDLIHQLGGQTR